MIGRRGIARWALFVVVAFSCGQAIDDPPAPQSEGTALPLPEGQALEPGTYTIDLDDHGVRVMFDVPSGYEGWKYGIFASAEGPGPPAGAGVSFWVVDNVYADPCRWDEGLLEPPPDPSAPALADALKTRLGRVCHATVRRRTERAYGDRDRPGSASRS